MAFETPVAPGPNALSSPVPGEKAQAMPAPVAQGAPQATQPMAQPQPAQEQAQAPDQQRQPASAPSAVDEFNQVSPGDITELNAGPPGVQSGPKSFDGTMVEGNFMGFKARVTPEGEPQIFVPRTKKWQSANEDGGIWKQMAKGIYSTVESIPEVAASAVANTVIPGEGFIPGAGRALTAGALSGAGRGTGVSEYFASKFGTPQDFYILKKIAGVQGEPGVVASALTSAGAQAVMEVGGKIANMGAEKSAAQAETQQSVLNILQQGKSLEKAAQESGIPVRGTQIAAQLPGGGAASSLEQGMEGGQFGAVNQANIQVANQQQVQAIGSAVDRLVKRVAPGVDFDNLDIAHVSGKGGQRLNFLDRIEQVQQQDLSANRAAVNELARNRQFNPQSVITSFETSIKKLLPFQKDLVKSDGTIDMERFMAVAKNEGYSDQSLSKFAQSYVSLKNAVMRQAEGLAKNPVGQGVSTAEALIPRNKAGEAEAGITFNQLSAFTDRIQDLAFSNGKDSQFTRALGSVASVSKGLEDDVTSQLFKENGQPAMAQRVLDQKEKYAASIGDLRQVSNLVAQNPDNAARSMFGAPLSVLKKVMPALSDQQKREVAGSLLVNAAYEDISKIPASSMISSVNADSIQKQFFGSAEARAKSEIVFGEAAPDLENILHVARMVQSPMGSTEKASVAGAGKILKIIPRMMTKGIPLDKVGVVLNSVFSDNPTAKDIINTSLSDMVLQQERALAKSVAKSKTSAAYAKVFNSKTARVGVAAGANFIKNEVGAEAQ